MISFLMLQGHQQILLDQTWDHMLMVWLVPFPMFLLASWLGRLAKLSISTSQLTIVSTTQTSMVPTQTSEVNSYSPHNRRILNNLEEIRRTKRKTLPLSKGLCKPKTLPLEALRRRRRLSFPAIFVVETISLTKCPRMDEIHHYFSQQ
jgi:hypothetical protein